MLACLVVVTSLWFSFGGTVSCLHLCCFLLTGILNLILVVKPVLFCFTIPVAWAMLGRGMDNELMAQLPLNMILFLMWSQLG